MNDIGLTGTGLIEEGCTNRLAPRYFILRDWKPCPKGVLTSPAQRPAVTTLGHAGWPEIGYFYQNLYMDAAH
jgi:hypothetical protein